jgi:ribosome-associated heat shock protein Hsp15
MMSSQGTANATSESVRLDKWLWAARIFKTRALAGAAVSGGKVHLNGARVKPAHPIRPRDTLVIQRGDDELTIEVQALSIRRGPAPIAATLYEETAESRTTRAERAAARTTAPHFPHPKSRPTKKQRRALTHLTHKQRF